ncbi:universal stress protein [Aeromicrobium piscarium]|uniref:Universal stress protein n=1 Tax=Aeromicrobium piscarium TaxID=2590901 RepID=A0A554SPP2_9ACTN|nr:universal stress protein [Aeromicrobium piscarium]TSD68333.1 universal stress protein [Aeromicrobium piscarium]
MTVAVAHHDSPEGHAALRAGIDLARRLGGDLAVLHVLDDDLTGDVEAARRDAGERVGRALEGIGDEVRHTVHIVAAGGDIAQALIDLTTEADAEMLIIGARRRSPVGKLLMGSVVQRVVLDSPVPVLVVKP